jgi:GDP-L-fucose synthase
LRVKVCAEDDLVTSYNLEGKRVWVAGHRGMVGSALVRRLESEKCTTLIAGSSELDLRDATAVNRWAQVHRPDAVIIAAAKVGGIMANVSLPADFIYDNLMIASNVIKSAHENKMEKVLFLGSSCIYPKFAPQPMPESALLTGPLEPTNEWYAVAKIAGIKLCQAFRRQHGDDMISAMPTNLYGPGDNFDLQTSHVLPALLRKMHTAHEAGDPTVTIWGSGTPLREFMYVDDLADACVFLMKEYSGDEHVNVGSSQEVSIRGLAELIAGIVGFKGELVFDHTKPDGTPRKLLDGSKLAGLGWTATHSLEDGIRKAYAAFLSTHR